MTTATFLSSPRAAPESVDTRYAVYGIPIGVPYSAAQLQSDARNAPAAVRERSARFGRMLGHHDFDLGRALAADGRLSLVDCGDAAVDAGDPRAGAARATAAVRTLLARGAVPLVLGGDDSITAIAIAAFDGHGPLTVVQVDAHIDYRDEVGGVRDGYSSPMRRAAEMPWVRQVIHCGTRGVGSARPSDLADTLARGNRVFTDIDVQAHGVRAVLDACPPGGRYYIAFDCDGMDPGVMPGTSAPVPGGLSFRQAADLFSGLARRGTVVGASFAEHFPSLDVNGITALGIVRLIVNLIGACDDAAAGAKDTR